MTIITVGIVSEVALLTGDGERRRGFDQLDMDSADALAGLDNPVSQEPSLHEEGTIKNDRPPIIGILSQELSVSIKERFPEYKSFIAASYVKSIEAAGARVVPILAGQDDSYYREQVKLVNGVLYPGGACYFNVSGGFAEAGEKVYNLALEANRAGDYFPLFGVCLGFELLLHLSNNKQELRTECEASNVGLPITFKPNFRNSQLYRHAHNDVLNILKSEPVTSNHHRWCVTEASITKLGLDKQWEVLSLGKDKNQLEFISSIEMKHYPIAAVQFHPEKNAYEWKESQNNPHSFKAIYSQRHYFDWFVKEARRNTHSFPSKENELAALIDNYPPVFTGKYNMYYEQIYLFK